MQVVPECQNARLIALYIDNTGKIRRRVPIRQQGGKPFGHAVLFQFFILPDSGCFFLHFKRKESPRSQAEAPLATKLLQQKPGKMFRGLYDYVQTRSPAPTAARPAAVSCSLRSRRSLRRTRSRPALSPSRRTTSSRLPTTCSARLTSSTPSPWNESSRRPSLPGGSWIT